MTSSKQTERYKNWLTYDKRAISLLPENEKNYVLNKIKEFTLPFKKRVEEIKNMLNILSLEEESKKQAIEALEKQLANLSKQQNNLSI